MGQTVSISLTTFPGTRGWTVLVLAPLPAHCTQQPRYGNNRRSPKLCPFFSKPKQSFLFEVTVSPRPLFGAAGHHPNQSCIKHCKSTKAKTVSFLTQAICVVSMLQDFRNQRPTSKSISLMPIKGFDYATKGRKISRFSSGRALCTMGLYATPFNANGISILRDDERIKNNGPIRWRFPGYATA